MTHDIKRQNPLPAFGGQRSLLFALCVGLCFVLGLGPVGCAPSYPNVLKCEDLGEIHAICGLQNPEDLALLPNQPKVIVSQFGSMDGSRPGNLALFDLASETVELAFQGGVRPTGEVNEALWGDRSCPGPPEARFSPHGIDLARLDSGHLRLLVVNHGGREAVEFFEVKERPDEISLIWRGCAVPPSGTYMNDVVSLPDAGFLVTHMMPRDSQILGMVKAMIGLNTGRVYEWQQGAGFTAVPGTDAPFPNGIELATDAQSLFLNVYSSGQVRRIHRRTGRELGRAHIPSPDNITWGRDGRLLVASHSGSFFDQVACMKVEQGACGMKFSVIALDPESMETENLFTQAGPPMGAGTVALDLGLSEFLIGSYAGDRMLRVKLPR